MSDLKWRHLRGGDEGAIWVLASQAEIEEYRSFSPYGCKHLHTEIRDQRTSNGGIQRKEQCLQCGMPRSQPTKILKGVIAPAWDDRLWGNWESACLGRQLEIEDFLRRRQESTEYEGYIYYEDYLRSAEWEKRRQLVLNRDGNLCQACLENSANEVHHLTYDHIFHEFLFELVAVCRSCHERLHSKKVAATEAARAKGLGIKKD